MLQTLSTEPRRLRDELMPAQLVWLSAEMDKPAATDEDRTAVHGRLFDLVATCSFLESFYLADVAKVMLTAHATGLSGDGGSAFTLPGLTFGNSPAPAAAARKYDELATSPVSVRPHDDEEGSEAFDVLSFVVYAARTAVVHARFELSSKAPQLLDFGAEEFEKLAEQSLYEVICAFAAQCQFKQTGDAYLHAVLQLRLPAWPFSGQVSGASPFKTASRLLADGTNDAVRPLIDAGVDPFLTRLQEPSEMVVDQHAAETFAVVASLVDEMCGKRTLLVNDRIAQSPPDAGNPRPFVNGDFGCFQPHCYGVVDGPGVWLAQRPLQAVAAVLSRSQPGTLQARLWEVVSAPAGADLPGNPFSKYIR